MGEPWRIKFLRKIIHVSVLSASRTMGEHDGGSHVVEEKISFSTLSESNDGRTQ